MHERIKLSLNRCDWLEPASEHLRVRHPAAVRERESGSKPPQEGAALLRDSEVNQKQKSGAARSESVLLLRRSNESLAAAACVLFGQQQFFAVRPSGKQPAGALADTRFRKRKKKPHSAEKKVIFRPAGHELEDTVGDAMLQSVLLVWLLGVLVGGQHPLLDHPQHQPLDFNKGRCRRSTLGAAHFRGRAVPAQPGSVTLFFLLSLSVRVVCFVRKHRDAERSTR